VGTSEDKQKKKRRFSDLDMSMHSVSSDEFFLSSDLDMDTPKLSVELSAPGLSTAPKRVRRTSSDSFHDQDDVGFRTGRWTNEETAYSDKLISYFKDGHFPLPNGFKLNEFLASMLKSKQSRLTKKMKHAKLSSNTYFVTCGYISETDKCIDFSLLEDNFLNSISDAVERAETRLHIQKEWRELFCAYAVSRKISVVSHDLLKSIDELEKRMSSNRDAAKMLRRQIMTGCALNLDSSKCSNGVFIDRSDVPSLDHPPAVDKIANYSALDDFFSSSSVLSSKFASTPFLCQDNASREGSDFPTSPFLVKVTEYIKRYHLPFEYVELWVPAVPPDDLTPGDKSMRLYMAGNALCDNEVPKDSHGQIAPISAENKFNMSSFGKYSQMFSFAMGSGVPGYVYETCTPYWKLISDSDHFERKGGAEVWGMKTVAAITLTSPTVGKLVLLLISKHERVCQEQVLLNLRQEMLKYPPCPKWTLVVEIGEYTPVPPQDELTSDTILVQAEMRNPHDEIISILGEQISFNPSCPSVDGILSLRILLLRTRRTQQEDEVVSTITASYLSYVRNGRSKEVIAKLLARDFLFLQQHYAYELNAIPNTVEGPIEEPFWEYHDVSDESTSSDTNNFLCMPLTMDEKLLSAVLF
jgi:hypothetical protein